MLLPRLLMLQLATVTIKHYKQTPGNILCRVWRCIWGTGIRRLMTGMATLPQGNQELLVSRDKVGRLPGELGVSKIHGMWYFSLQWFNTVGWATGRASGLQKLDVGLLVVMISLELCMTYSSSSPVVTTTSIFVLYVNVLCFNKHQLTQAGKWPLKWREREREYGGELT